MTATVIDQPPLQAIVAPRPVAFYVRATLLALLIFAAIAPTLTMLNFSNGSEGLNVGTVQEMHRTGEWLIPTLQGRTRLAKPPLTAWVTGICVSDQTMTMISSADPAIRNTGYSRLAWETRWLMLAMGCLTLLLTAELGRLLVSEECGIIAMIVAGTSLLFLRFIRYSSTDVLLMLFVAAANVSLAHAVLRGRVWAGCIGAGVALGLGMMSKGPVCLVQSIVPFAIWMAWDRRRARESRWPGVGPVLTALALFLAIGSTWFIMVYLREPKAMSIWWEEVTREGATDAPPDEFYKYLSLFPLMLPWMPFLFVGGIVALLRRGERAFLPLVLLVAPIVLMSLAKDKPERYLLPMLPAAGIVVAMGLTLAPRIPAVTGAQWIILGFFAIGFPIASMLLDPPYATPVFGGICAIVGTLLLCAGLSIRRPTHTSLICTALLVMLGVQFLFINGYRHSRSGIAELRPISDLIATQYPTARVWNGHPTGKFPPPEVGVYLNRTIQTPVDNNPLNIPVAPIPQVVLLRQNSGEPDPTLPAPWQYLTKAPRDRNWWWAFIQHPQ